MIYFILDPSMNTVKIGYTGSPATLKTRMKRFKCGNAADLRLLHLEKGDRRKESRLHHEFENLKKDGEWYWNTGTLALYLRRATTNLDPNAPVREYSKSQRIPASFKLPL